jgi:hypothetical protein
MPVSGWSKTRSARRWGFLTAEYGAIALVVAIGAALLRMPIAERIFLIVGALVFVGAALTCGARAISVARKP